MVNCDNIRISHLGLNANGNAANCVYLEGSQNSRIELDSCRLENAGNGIQSEASLVNLALLNSEIRNMRKDGINAKYFDKVTIRNCRISNVNMEWFADQSAEGDCIDLNSPQGSVEVSHCYADHSATGNGNAVRLSGSDYNGVIEYNTLRSGQAPDCELINLSSTNGTVVARYNSLEGGMTGIHSHAAENNIYYNIFLNSNVAVRIEKDKSAGIFNNTFIQGGDCIIETLEGSQVTAMNNIYVLDSVSSETYRTHGTIISDYNLFNIQKQGFLSGFNTLDAWSSFSGQDLNSVVSDPLFTDPEAGDYTLSDRSPAINKGADIHLTEDYFGTSVPQYNIPDIGFCESDSQLLETENNSQLNNSDIIVNVSVYPNPTPDKINISFERTDEKDITPVVIRILSENGNVVASAETIDQQLIEFDLGRESRGAYFVVINCGGELVSRKVLLQ